MFRIDAKRSSLLKGVALFSGSTTIAQVIMMVYVILLARILGPGQLGIFNSAYSLVGLTAFILNIGMDTWLLRKAGLFSDVTVLTGKILKIKASIGLLWMIALIFLAPLIRPDLYTKPMMLICSVDLLSDVWFNTEILGLNVQRKMKAITWLMFVSRGGRLLGLAILYFLGVNSAVVFALGRMLATLVGFVIATFVHRPHLQTNKLLTNQEILRESVPFALSDFLSLIYTNIDVTILALMAGATAVGYYSPASGIIHALFVIPNAMSTVLIPPITQLGASSEGRFRSSLRGLFLSFSALGVISWIVVGMFGKGIILFLLGDQFQLSGELLTILSPILFLKAISFACTVVLVSVGWQKKRLLYQFLSAAFNIIANVIIIPLYGVVGVSWVYLASEVILAVGYIGVTINWIRRGEFVKG